MTTAAPQEPALQAPLTIDLKPTAHPLSDAERARRLENPGFGRVFTEHMVAIKWSAGRGWHDAQLTPYAPLEIDPANMTLHYAQSIFEGLKAYRRPDGSVATFRPQANAARFQNSARRLAMPELPQELFVAAVEALVRQDSAWVPTKPEESLYLRPFMFATEVGLGVKPANEFLFMVIASPAGPYFAGGVKPVSVWLSQEYVRAVPGGTGEAKCAGNYAASLIAQAQAIEQGCDQVVWLDAVERRWIEELGGMNMFFVFDDGSIVTPPLSGTILPGITRDAIITLARDAGLTVREELYAIDQWQADAESGRLTESFACGTAAVVTPVGKVTRGETSFTIGAGGPGQVTGMLKDKLVNIQRGRAADPHGWVTRL